MSSQPSLNIAFFASGNGSNFERLVSYALENHLPISFMALICNQAGAAVLKRAERLKIPALLIESKNKSREQFEEECLKQLKEWKIDWIFLAGFMRLLSASFIEKYPSKIVNIHPSLLPHFKGMNAIQQAYESDQKVSGCTVHLVDEGCDTGPILAQQIVTKNEHESLESFEAKIHQAEYDLYPKVLEKICREHC